MKKKPLILTIISVVVISIVAVISIFLLNNQQETVYTFSLFKETGEVFYKKTLNSDYIALSGSDVKLESGAYVKTGSGRAQVVFPDNSVSYLDENTELQVNIDNTGVHMFQSLGNTWNSVTKLEKGKGYTIENGKVFAAVRGTKFSFSSSDNTPILAEVKVFESKVDVMKVVDDNKTNLKLSEATSVVAGKMIQVVKDTDMQKTAPVELIKDETEWSKKILDIDTKIDDAKLRKVDVKQVLREINLIVTTTPEVNETATPTMTATPTLTPTPVVTTIKPTIKVVRTVTATPKPTVTISRTITPIVTTVTPSPTPYTGKVTSISLSKVGTYAVSWSSVGISANGYKVVWSKTPGATYPGRYDEEDDYDYLSDPTANSHTFCSADELSAGSGDYYVRVCAYINEAGFTCSPYSNEVVVNIP